VQVISIKEKLVPKLFVERSSNPLLDRFEDVFKNGICSYCDPEAR